MEWLERTELLLGRAKLDRLRQANVLIVGLGGVGAYAAEMICRAGVGSMTIADADTVSASNINRQLVALTSTIGQAKTSVLAQRLLDINPDLQLRTVGGFIKDEATYTLLDSEPYTYVVDAIDTLSPKAHLIKGCLDRGIPVVSSMGAGAKTDPTKVEIEDMINYLDLLEIPVEGDNILVPSFRPDLIRMADIAEEVGRSYGYNKIPVTEFKTSTQGGYSREMKLETKAGTLCRAMGSSEIITYSFVSPTVFDQIRLPADSVLRNAMKIQNPLGEDTSIMRTVALPSMLEILSRNNAYHNKAAKLYEVAKVYLPQAGEKLPQEPKMLMLGTYGSGETFFTLKGELEGIFRALRMKKTEYTAEKNNPSYHPGRCARIAVDGEEIGVMGQVHPLVAKNYGIDAEVYCAELNFTKMLSLMLPDPTYVPLPKYPAVSRDLALVCDEEVTVAQAEKIIADAAGKLLRDVQLFDIYRGVGVPAGKKSMAFSLELRADDRTLTDADSEAVTNKILAALAEKLNATLR